MRRVRTYITLAVGLALVLGFGSLLAQWLMTGELHVTDRIPGQYVTFAQDGTWQPIDEHWRRK